MRDGRFIEGGVEAGERLIEWLTKKIKSTETEGDVEINLFQKAQTGEMDVDKFTFTLDGSLEELVEEIIEAAERDAENYRKSTRYGVRIEGKEQCLTFTLKVPPIDEDEDNELIDFEELPNRKGIIGQLMRHTEIAVKDMLTSSRMGRDDMMKENKDLRQENANLRRLYYDQVKHIEEIQSMQFARNMKIKEFEKSEERKDKATEMGFKVLPLLASKILGGENGAQFAAEVGAGSPIEQMVDGFVKSLESNPEKLEKIMQVLDPVDMVMFAEIHKRIQEKRQFEAQQAGQSQVNPNVQNGQANGNGFPFAHGPTNPFNGFNTTK